MHYSVLLGFCYIAECRVVLAWLSFSSFLDLFIFSLLQSRHPGLLASFEIACQVLSDKDKLRKKKATTSTTSSENDPGAPVLKQAKLDLSQSSQSQLLTQARVDKYVSDYIVNSVLPVHHVDSSSFKHLVSGLTGRRFQPRCRQTVTKQIEQEFKMRTNDLKVKLATLSTVCTTVDCWTSRQRGFIGMTVHWIEEETLERKGACLAVREIVGRHTYDVLAKVISGVNEEFGITNKVCFTVTDSGSNFLKAFRHYAFDVEADNENPSEDDDADFEAVDVLRILNGGGNETVARDAGAQDESVNVRPNENENENNNNTSVDCDEEDSEEQEYQLAVTLPPHRKCATHRLNLVATTDIAKSTEEDIRANVCQVVWSMEQAK